MRKLNGFFFYEEPTSCGTCPFFNNFQTSTPLYVNYGNTGHCTLFDEMHKTWRSVPRRCVKLFRKLFEQPDGGEYVIVVK